MRAGTMVAGEGPVPQPRAGCPPGRRGSGSGVRWNRPAALRPGGSRASQPPSFPAGCLCTVGVLAYGIICFKKGQTRRSQLMMRARVLAQGITIVSLVGGMVATTIKSRQ